MVELGKDIKTYCSSYSYELFPMFKKLEERVKMLT